MRYLAFTAAVLATALLVATPFASAVRSCSSSSSGDVFVKHGADDVFQCDVSSHFNRFMRSEGIEILPDNLLGNPFDETNPIHVAGDASVGVVVAASQTASVDVNGQPLTLEKTWNDFGIFKMMSSSNEGTDIDSLAETPNDDDSGSGSVSGSIAIEDAPSSSTGDNGERTAEVFDTIHQVQLTGNQGMGVHIANGFEFQINAKHNPNGHVGELQLESLSTDVQEANAKVHMRVVAISVEPVEDGTRHMRCNRRRNEHEFVLAECKPEDRQCLLSEPPTFESGKYALVVTLCQGKFKRDGSCNQMLGQAHQMIHVPRSISINDMSIFHATSPTEHEVCFEMQHANGPFLQLFESWDEDEIPCSIAMQAKIVRETEEGQEELVCVKQIVRIEDDGHARFCVHRDWFGEAGTQSLLISDMILRDADDLNVIGTSHTHNDGLLSVTAEIPAKPHTLLSLGEDSNVKYTGVPPEGHKQNRRRRLLADTNGDGQAVVLVHGYCQSQGGNVWPQQDFTDFVVYDHPNENVSHDQFARQIAADANAMGVFGGGCIGYSQGGAACTHLYNYYWSFLDYTATGTRKIQAIATPFEGTALAGNVAALGDIFGAGCGYNYDMTYDGAANWLSGIASWAKSQVYARTVSFTDKWWRYDYCHLASDVLLSDPDDGTVEKWSGFVGGMNSLGHKTGWCHTTGMRDPPVLTDHTSNQQFNAAAQR